MRKQRRFARIALILALFTALVGGTVVLAVASPAMAATCSGNGCNGLDPIATGCQNSYTQLVGSSEIKNGSTHYGWIDLRYSPTCGTNWSRVRSDIGTQNLEAFIIRTSDNLAYTESGYFQIAWTNMVYAPTVTACAQGTINLYGAPAVCA